VRLQRRFGPSDQRHDGMDLIGASSSHRAPVSELLSSERLEFYAANLTEFAKRVDRSAVHHLPQLEEALVRLQIRIENLSSGLFRVFDDLWRGKDAHPANFCVKPDQGGNVCFIVL
jgi:hypothetical protein